ncbi:MAG: helix-turn-helix domain-containing protein [Candidatus Pacearchaeota archaeon]
MYELLLEKAGLTKGEAKVYLTLLKIGETTTGNIIKESGLSGSKVYEIINRLIKKGLVSFIVKERTKWFKAATPRKLLEYLDMKTKELNKIKKRIN